MWEGFETNFLSLSRSLDFRLPESPPHRILKGGNLWQQRKKPRRKPKRKRSKLSFEMWGCGGEINPP
jgi:hypothetical protein